MQVEAGRVAVHQGEQCVEDLGPPPAAPAQEAAPGQSRVEAVAELTQQGLCARCPRRTQGER